MNLWDVKQIKFTSHLIFGYLATAIPYSLSILSRLTDVLRLLDSFLLGKFHHVLGTFDFKLKYLVGYSWCKSDRSMGPLIDQESSLGTQIILEWLA